MCNRLLAVLTAITVLSMAVVETGSAQQALTQSQAFSAGYATCPVRQVAIGLLVLYGVTVCSRMLPSFVGGPGGCALRLKAIRPS
jgi:hypothetical protein